MAIKPKIWLRDNGHMTAEEAAKKGRMSLVNKALVEAAVARGVNIEGYSVVREDSPTGETPKVERVAVDPNRVVDVPDAYRDERTLMAYHMVEGKRVEIGMRTVDNNCGSSLTYCACESPRVWVDHDHQVVVNFAPRN